MVFWNDFLTPPSIQQERTVSKTQELYTLWAIDLSDAGLAALGELAEGRFALEAKPEIDPACLADLPAGEIFIFCLSLAAWKKMLAQGTENRDIIARMPKIIVLPENCTAADMESASQHSFSAILKEPLSRERLLSALAATVESQLVFSDVVRMTKEIILDRELLNRKNHNLAFLLNFLSRTASKITPLEVMETAWETLSDFMPVESIGVILWHSPSIPVAPMSSHMFIPAENNTAPCAAWIEILLKAEREYSPFAASNYVQETLHNRRPNAKAHYSPATGRTMVLPLKSGGHNTGAIALSLSADYDVTRDRLEVLESAVGHLDLAMRNAFTLLLNRRNAELDTLTSAYNRRHFEETIAQELIRHERCRGDMSLLLVDIDHFKSINDTYGHQVGDTVLREIVNLLHSRLRSVDYLARYGGEEFVIILPHTTLNDALQLAERLRKTVAGHAFCSDTLQITATISVGVSTCGEDLRLSSQELFHNADMAMYQAKHLGRNQIFCADGRLTELAQG